MNDKKVDDAIPTLDQFFGPAGLMAAQDPTYEDRPAQIEMANHVLDLLSNANDKQPNISIIEAGTGVGKTLAYLIPAILTQMKSKRTTGHRQSPIVVSTDTKTLQKQIMEKEIPMIEDMLGSKLNIAVVYGRGNYVSKRLLNEALTRAREASERSENPNPLDKERLKILEDLVEKEKIPGFSGNFDDITRSTKIDEETRSEIQSDSKNCLGKECPTYNSCYYYKKRRDMEKADIVVINHHLLIANLILAIQMNTEEGFLSEFDKLINDEAHELWTVAANSFVKKLSWSMIQKRLDKIFKYDEKVADKKKSESGILKNIPPHGNVPKIKEEFSNCRVKIGKLFDKVRSEFRHSAKNTEFLEIRPNLSYGSDECDLVADDLDRLCKHLDDFVTAKSKEPIVPSGDLGNTRSTRQRAVESGYTLMDFEAHSENLKELASDIRTWLAGVEGRSEESTDVYWAECSARVDEIITKEKNLALCSSPIMVGQILQQHLFNKGAVVLTSATIDVCHSFDNFKFRLGLDKVPENTNDLILKSPFDIKNQAKVNIYDNENMDHDKVIRQLIANGRVMILFTSYESLEETYQRNRVWMKKNGLHAFKQQKRENFHDVVNNFKAEPMGVLFATSSGWQGVDIKGDALQTVVITKLPFSSDFGSILSMARSKYLETLGSNYWDVFSFPDATLKLIQGVGRLIRSTNDKGTIAILDSRLNTKFFGHKMKKALVSKGYTLTLVSNVPVRKDTTRKNSMTKRSFQNTPVLKKLAT